jgi:hypothetical protein
VDIVVRNNDRELSRLHFVLVRDEDGYLLQNESENGTRVNGAEVKRPRRLAHRDRIEAGSVTFFEYLVLTRAERAAALGHEMGKEEATAEPEGTPSRPLWKRPIFLAILGFYLLLGLVILGASGGKETRVPDPGDGPYLAARLARPFSSAPAAPEVGRRVPATWERALAEHGGPLETEGGHAWSLVLTALSLLEAEGRHADFAAALATGSAIAREAKRIADALEKRLADLHREGEERIRGRHLTEAREIYRSICEAIPDRSLPLFRFASDRLRRLPAPAAPR